MANNLKYNECKRQCRYNFSKEELLEIGKRSADDGHNKAAFEADLERIKKDYKARVETLEAQIESSFEKMRSGYELRETLCFWEYNTPRPGRKILKRADTFDIVGEEDMTGTDTQTVMETVDAEAAKATATTPAPEPKLVLAAPDPAVDPWPEFENVLPKRDPLFGSDRYKSSTCEIFAGLLKDLFYLPNDPTCANDEELRRETSIFVEKHKDTATCAELLDWIEERPRPGGRKVAALLREAGVKTPGEIEADAAKPTAPEHKTKKGAKGPKARRTSSNGVVGVESDGDDLNNPDDNKRD